MNQVLKHEIGFQGYVMSDWQATESTLGAEAGLDVSLRLWYIPYDDSGAKVELFAHA